MPPVFRGPDWSSPDEKFYWFSVCSGNSSLDHIGDPSPYCKEENKESPNSYVFTHMFFLLPVADEVVSKNDTPFSIAGARSRYRCKCCRASGNFHIANEMTIANKMIAITRTFLVPKTIEIIDKMPASTIIERPASGSITAIPKTTRIAEN